jgi:hypothetical protein
MKRNARRRLAALPFAEKLRILDELRERSHEIAAFRLRKAAADRLSSKLAKRTKCIDPKIGAQIPLEIASPSTTGGKPELSRSSELHLRECASCCERLPVWYERAQIALISKVPFDMVNSAEDTSIIRRETKSGMALFKPDPDNSNVGTFVLITADNVIHDPERTTLTEFERFE